jgi:V8-like Glu-specific endopeptidase
VCATTPGQSGSPILAQINKSIYAVGLHIQSESTEKVNIAIQFTNEIILQVLLWENEMREERIMVT